jgi:Asp-tRNA(Asn)/Glu-tRNA(Gln) amidotransferase C subunit
MAMDEETVRRLARAADLELPAERLPLVARQLGAWLDAANELNAKLAEEDHVTVVPITTFRHPGAEGKEG